MKWTFEKSLLCLNGITNIIIIRLALYFTFSKINFKNICKYMSPYKIRVNKEW